MLTFLLMGKTGHGKSSTGNTLLNRIQYFKTSGSATAVTACVKSGYGYFEKYSIKVVDGPGLCDTDSLKEQNIENTINNMITALAMCDGGVDAFLFVLRFPVRFTKEEQDVLKSLRGIFGENYFKHIIVVMAGGDNFEKEDGLRMSFDAWCKAQKGPFLEFCKACQGRVVLMNNFEEDSQKNQKQRDELVAIAETLRSVQGRYSADLFRQAKAERDRFILEHNAPQLTEEIQEKIGLLTSVIKNSIQLNKKEVEEMMENVKAEIKLKDRGTGALKKLIDLIEHMRINLNDKHTLNMLCDQLEVAKESRNEWGLFVSEAAATIGAAILGVLSGPARLITGVTQLTVGAIFWAVAKLEEKKTEKERDKLKEKLFNQKP